MKPGIWIALVCCAVALGFFLGRTDRSGLRDEIKAKEAVIDSLNTIRASQWLEIRAARDSILFLDAQVKNQRPTQVIVRETVDGSRRRVRSLSLDSLSGLWATVISD